MNILIVGVGGQGTILTARVLGEYAQRMGLDVKVSEVHGMAQRGGCVVTHVRMEKTVLSPLIEEGTADVILAFEAMEAMRWLPRLKMGGLVIAAKDRIVPPSVTNGQAKYPENVAANLPENTIWVDAVELAKKAGSVRAANIVLLGVFTAAAGLDQEQMRQAIVQSVRPVFREMNDSAFTLGYGAVNA
ncbi:MAG: indolepyruvate oxidoreductase subunit beta [Clostridia bacterium]|nr:indolepyruvate oxidoreductase subunit beta [Clostridia bacterium]